MMNPLLTVSNQTLPAILNLIGSAALKGALIVLAVYLLMRLSRASAATRHWIWVMVIGGLLSLPVLTALSPAWRLAILPEVTSQTQSTPFSLDWSSFEKSAAKVLPDKTGSLASIPAPAATLAPISKQIAVPVKSAVPVAKTIDGSEALPVTPLVMLAFLIWLGGVIFSMGRWLWQWIAIRKITADGLLIDDLDWQTLVDAISAELHVHQRIWLIATDQVAVPMTWGVRQPVVLLPCEALGWPSTRRRIVLLHELAHVARRDYVTQWLTLIACALYWFNPAVWLAARQSTLERERASDDVVLNAGIKNTEYAAQLLEIASAARRNRRSGALGLALARHSALTERITSILSSSPRLSRCTVSSARRLMLIGLIGLTLWPLSGVQLARVSAQSTAQSIVLTIALPDYLKDTFNDSILKDFQTANPGIQVHVVDSQPVPEAAFGLTDHLTALQKYASSADVLFITNFDAPQITAQATRAGAYLDLTPLVSTDTSLKVDDFVPSVWRSYQWDNGIWALPLDATLYTLNYKPAVFDQARLTYPADSWTATDFLNAVNKLTVKNADGQVVTSGFATTGGYSREVMLRVLTGANLFDPSIVPNPPMLDQPKVTDALNTFSQLQNQNLIGQNPDQAAMGFAPLDLSPKNPANPDSVAALLPGHTALMETNALAISGGTANPDAAYALAKFLTLRTDFVTGDNSTLTARRSMTDASPFKLPANLQPLVDEGVANAITASDMRFADYLRIADNNIGPDLDARTAVANAQSQASADVIAATAQKGKLALSIKEPEAVTLPAGKIALNFDMAVASKGSGPLPTQAAWDSFIADFTAHDPQVAQVNLSITNHTANQAATHSDCFYIPFNAVPEVNESSVLSLDPYLTSDPNFDRADLFGTVYAGVQRDGKTWAYPLTIDPPALVYDPAKFTQANVPLPTAHWTTDSFVDALDHLKAISNPSDPQTTAPYVGSGDGTPLLMLIADYGGLPIDYRTSPPTINFTDPKTLDAIRQVLDLVKKGDIAYGALGSLFGRNTPNFNQTTAMFNLPLTDLTFLKGNPKGQALLGKTPQIAMFPVGHAQTGVSYDLGAAYISATAQSPDACYRFIQAMSAHPALFWNMPARRSNLTNATYKTATDPDILALYTQFAARLDNPHTVPFPSSVSEANSLSILFPQHWLFEAFDDYVLHNGDLATDLRNADQESQGYLGCIANLPPVNLNGVTTTNINVVKPFADCAERMEPALKAQLAPIIGS